MSVTGIDLSATRCHLLETRSSWRTTSRDVVVRAFETIPHGWTDPAALEARLRDSLRTNRRHRRARATVWGLATVHRSMWLPATEPLGPAERAVVRDAGTLAAGEVIVRSMEGGTRAATDGSPGREVAVALASRDDLRARLQPLVAAGFRVEACTTPPVALCSVARLTRHLVPGEALGLLAIGAETTALAIVRDGLPLLARELPWGYQRAGARMLDRDQLVTKLSSDLRRSMLFIKQTTRSEVSRILVCGDVPGIRSLTAPLIRELDVEVETLDSLEGIAAGALPAPAESFRAQVGAFRLAWALAADARPPLAFTVPDAGEPARPGRQMAGLAAGMAVALALGGAGYRIADRTARLGADRVASLERRIREIDPAIQAIEQARADRESIPRRRAALAAIAAQGPRLTHVLEAVARLTPADVTLETMAFTSSDGGWTATLSGTASAADSRRAREAVGELLRGMDASPYVAGSVGPPVFRVTDAGIAPAGGPGRPPARVRFSASFSIPN